MHENLLSLHTDTVRRDWIDYNGHMNDGYYAVAFSLATDAFMETIGIDAAYRARTQCTFYTAEMHITYLRELKANAPLTFTTHLLAYDAKRCHIFHRLQHGAEGYLAATCELMQLHVDQNSGKVALFPEEITSHLAEIYATHQAMPVPEQVGHVIAMRQRIEPVVQNTSQNFWRK